METIKEKLQEFNDSLDEVEREDNSTYIICNNDKYLDLIRGCHDGQLPNDKIYKFISDIVSTLLDYSDEDLDIDSESLISEIADRCTPIYTCEIL